MFDLGFSELFFIAIVALIVLGPERLPKAARFAGLWMRRARTQWQSVKSEFENEIADEQLRNTLKQTRQDLQEARDSIVRSGQDMEREFTDIGASARDLNNAPSATSPAGVAAAATGADSAAPASDAAPASGPADAQPAVAGDNYYLEELDEDPYPDGFPGTNMIKKDETDGQR